AAWDLRSRGLRQAVPSRPSTDQEPHMTIAANRDTDAQVAPLPQAPAPLPQAPAPPPVASAPPPAAPAPPPAAVGPAAMWIVLTGVFMATLDFFIVNVAIPAAQ